MYSIVVEMSEQTMVFQQHPRKMMEKKGERIGRCQSAEAEHAEQSKSVLRSFRRSFARDLGHTS